MLDFLIHHASAADYQLLAPIPGLLKSGSSNMTDFSTYIPNLVKLVIGLAGGFAVLRIIMGGFLYVSSDAFGKKSEAKETIQNALIGLLLAMSAYVILYTINPKLVDIGFTLQGVGSSKPLSSEIGGNGEGLCTPEIPCTGGVAITCVGTNCSGGYTTQKCSTEHLCESGRIMCENCTGILPLNPPFPAKKPSDNGCEMPGPCQVDKKLEEYLINISGQLKKAGVPWQVTEMYPPTVPHIDPCHQNGRCVDAAIIYPSGTSGPNSAYIEKLLPVLDNFLSNKEQPGISYEYEICPKSRLKNFLTATAGNKVIQSHSAMFKCEITTTGESFHIELNNNSTF